ncbi:hypothetical protein GQR58_009398 [Nymphon striatum]|nr:hypothetical protein GQR58_009398 [Nymphon striatum]
MPRRKIRFLDLKIDFVTAHTHLGFTIAANLPFKPQIDSINRKVARQVFLLKQLRQKTSNRDLLLSIYKLYIRPHFEYAKLSGTIIKHLSTTLGFNFTIFISYTPFIPLIYYILSFTLSLFASSSLIGRLFYRSQWT